MSGGDWCPASLASLAAVAADDGPHVSRSPARPPQRARLPRVAGAHSWPWADQSLVAGDRPVQPAWQFPGGG
jgi:hypothetical protein